MNEQFHYAVVAEIVDGQPAFYCDPSIAVTPEKPIWNDKTGTWRGYTDDDHTLDNQFMEAFRTRLGNEPTLKISELAEILDKCADEDGQWDGGDLCQAIADIVQRHNGFARCLTHGVYAATKPRCPFNHQLAHIEGETDYGV